MKKIYVAGAMSGTELEYLRNLRKGIRLSLNVLQAGFCPFSPFIDYPFFLALREDEEITGEQIKAYSLEWLEVCDAILLVPGYENSKGTLAEIKRAEELGIPIFTTLTSLIEHFENYSIGASIGSGASE
jgi:hypothetical protein